MTEETKPRTSSVSIQSLLNESPSKSHDSSSGSLQIEKTTKASLKKRSGIVKKNKIAINPNSADEDPSIPDRRKKNNDAVRRFRERTKRKKLELKEAYEQNEQRIEELNALIAKLTDELDGRIVNHKELIDSFTIDQHTKKNMTQFKQHSVNSPTST